MISQRCSTSKQQSLYIYIAVRCGSYQAYEPETHLHILLCKNRLIGLTLLEGHVPVTIESINSLSGLIFSDRSPLAVMMHT